MFDSLKSRLGRKLSLVFLLAAMVPLIVVSLVIYEYTASYVLEQRSKDLGKEAKILDLVVRERLIFLSEMIVSAHRDGGRAQTRGRYFRRTHTSGVSPGVSLASDAHIIKLDVQDSGVVDLIIIDGANPSIQVHYEVNPDYLWGNLSVLSSEYDYCVFSHNRISLFCNGDLAPRQNLLRALIDEGRLQSKNRLSDTETGGEWLLVNRQFYFGDRIQAENWAVFTSLSMKQVFAPISFFQQLFLAVFILTLALILILSARQINRLLKPLKALSTGAEQIANRQFSKTVQVDSRDELEEVARAFNQMSKRISGHFYLLTSLSELDRLILGTYDVDQICGIVWSRMRQIVRGKCLFIATRGNAQATTLRCHFGAVHELAPDTLSMSMEGEGQASVPLVLKSMRVSRQTLKDVRSELDRCLLEYDFAELQIVPIIVEHQWMGFVALGCGDEESFSQDDLQLLDGLSDRLAVSISTASKRQELYDQAHYDYLTKLPNRKLLRDRLEQEIRHAEQQKTQVAVLFADLDNFKQINDSLGHTVGDQLLLNVSERLSSHLTGRDTVARQGGDEFILLLPFDDPVHLPERIGEILNLFREPIFLEGHFLYASLSLGVALFPRDGRDMDKLLMNADTALYKAKSKGKAGYLMYDESMNASALKRLEIENALWNAIEKQQLDFYYQPLVNLSDGSIGFEALMRWHHPERGVLAPGEFIRIAEETGLILDISKWMFGHIFKQINAWRKQNEFVLDKVSINVSPLQLLAPDFISILEQSIAEADMPVELIELEITEGVFLENDYQAGERLRALNQMGFSLALDDFGTGFSSLSYLQRLPFDRIKIDKSFVGSIREDGRVPPLIITIINMAKSLNLSITAEGVEQSFQFDLLRELGCDVLQGYHIAKPLPAASCLEFAKGYRLL